MEWERQREPAVRVSWGAPIAASGADSHAWATEQTQTDFDLDAPRHGWRVEGAEGAKCSFCGGREG